jgi:hypothetical protein
MNPNTPDKEPPYTDELIEAHSQQWLVAIVELKRRGRYRGSIQRLGAMWTVIPMAGAIPPDVKSKHAVFVAADVLAIEPLIHT